MHSPATPIRIIWLHIPQVDWVAAVGPFNNWSTTSTPLIFKGNDLWELELPSEIDLYAISFFVWPRDGCGGRVIRFADNESRENN
jgi:hypothetical protein